MVKLTLKTQRQFWSLRPSITVVVWSCGVCYFWCSYAQSMPVLHGMGMHGWHWRGRGTPYHQLQDVGSFPLPSKKLFWYVLVIKHLIESCHQLVVSCLDQQRGWHRIWGDGWTIWISNQPFLWMVPLDTSTNRFWESSRRQSSFETLSSFPFKGCLTFH